MGYLDRQIWLGRCDQGHRDWSGAFGVHVFHFDPERAVVAWLDIDRFTEEQSDGAARERADRSLSRMVADLRAIGAEVYRYRPFGDEFVLCLPPASLAALGRRAFGGRPTFTCVAADFSTADMGSADIHALAAHCEAMKAIGQRGRLVRVSAGSLR